MYASSISPLERVYIDSNNIQYLVTLKVALNHYENMSGEIIEIKDNFYPIYPSECIKWAEETYWGSPLFVTSTNKTRLLLNNIHFTLFDECNKE